MIGYTISRADLESQIEAEVPGWLQRAEERTEEFREQGYYNESSSIWSEVKSVYMKLQGDCKCAYCERKMESTDYGRIEQDVEHFRPKKKVKEWKIPKQLKDQGINVTDIPNEDHGYYLLPYHLLNYLASCKPCNSALKKNYFPISDEYDLHGEDPNDLLEENPYLIYPIGDFDEAPENLIRFHGLSPQAVANNGYRRARALVTIEFFKLDDTDGRKNLYLERARIIVALYPQLRILANGATGVEGANAQRVVNVYLESKAPHTNCARSFKILFDTDQTEANAIFNGALDLLTSSS